jgi:signal transduction histidine kinase
MSERLKELDTLKEDFVSHVSHTLRTPLTAIWEASEMLIKGIFDQDPPSRFQLLTIVRDECQRLIVSVNRILDLSRMEAGMMDYRFAQIDLNDLIRSAVEKLGPIAQAKSIRLCLEAQPGLPPVEADNDQMLQLLDNLIGNALKFTDPKGSVTLKSMVSEKTDGKIQVAIEDTGCGIEPEHLENIFNKFRRIEKGKNTARGTGLGLAIAKHIVAAHGGSIWVESQKGSGSTFYFSLPPA